MTGGAKRRRSRKASKSGSKNQDAHAEPQEKLPKKVHVNQDVPAEPQEKLPNQDLKNQDVPVVVLVE